MKIYWKDPVGKEIITGYEIWKAPFGSNPYFDGDQIATVASNLNYYDDADLTAGESCTYGVVILLDGEAPLELTPFSISLPSSMGPYSETLMVGDTSFGVYEYISPEFRIFPALINDIVNKGIATSAELSMLLTRQNTITKAQPVKISLDGRVYITTSSMTAAYTGNANRLIAINDAFRDYVFEFDGYKYRVSLPTREQMSKIGRANFTNVTFNVAFPKPPFIIAPGATDFRGVTNTASKCTIVTIDPKTPTIVTAQSFELKYLVSYVGSTAYYRVDTANSYNWTGSTITGAAAATGAINLLLEPIGQGE